MRPSLLSATAVLLLISTPPAAADLFEWSTLPSLPEPLGVAGPFVAVIDDKLVVAGGAHFELSPFQGGTKRWVDNAWVLDSPDGNWRATTPLPRPLAYGGSVSFGDSAVFVGGSDADRHYADAYRANFDGPDLVYQPIASLPEPTANGAAAELNGVIYVVAGQASPTSTTAQQFFLAFDTNAENPQWATVESPPGPARILAPLVSQDGALYLFSGAELLAGESGAATRRFLTDSYRFNLDEGWSQITDTPGPAAAAPAAALGPAHITIFGGDDGSNFFRNDELVLSCVSENIYWRGDEGRRRSWSIRTE